MTAGQWVSAAVAVVVAVDILVASAVAEQVCPGLVRRRRGSLRSPLAAVLTFLVLAYRAAWAGRSPGVCRFEPTCSAYALDALRRYGGLRGGLLVVYRLLRCQPLCKGGFDPVPVRSSTAAAPYPAGGSVPPPSSPSSPAVRHAWSGGRVPAAGGDRFSRFAFFRSRRSRPATAADSSVGTRV